MKYFITLFDVFGNIIQLRWVPNNYFLEFSIMRFWLCRMFFWLWLGLVRQWFLLQRCVCHRFGGWNICVCGWCGCVSWYGGDGWCGGASWFGGGSWFGGTVELNLKCFWLILLVILLRQNLVRLTGRPIIYSTFHYRKIIKY